MWKRTPGAAAPSWNVVENGDGPWSLGDRDAPISRQHPWISGLPVYAPEQWAPTYHYPLICYLHDDDRSERDLWQWFPAISDQNFLGLGVRAPFPSRLALPGKFRWRGQRPDATHTVLCEAIEEVQHDWNIHSDRIVLFGEGNGAVVALQQFMLNQFRSDQHEIQFSAAICRHLPEWWARALPPVAEFSAGRILLMEPVMNDEEGEIAAAVDGLREAGISVTVTHERNSSPAQAINHWIMSGIASAVY